MRFSEYKFKFYINANHAIYIDGKLGENHPHTWEVILDTIKIHNDFVAFDYIEKKAEEFLSRFQDCDLNKAEPFDTINPTLENITEYFKEELEKILKENGWLLSVISVAETPARAYIIDVSDETSLRKAEISDAQPRTLDEKADRKIQEVLGE